MTCTLLCRKKIEKGAENVEGSYTKWEHDKNYIEKVYFLKCCASLLFLFAITYSERILILIKARRAKKVGFWF
jgi:hypothetical protein